MYAGGKKYFSPAGLCKGKEVTSRRGLPPILSLGTSADPAIDLSEQGDEDQPVGYPVLG